MTAAQPRQHRRVLGKQADLAGVGRAQLQGHPDDVDRPGPLARPRAAPAPIAIEAEVGGGPGIGLAACLERPGRRPIDDALAELLQASGTADIEQLVA